MKARRAMVTFSIVSLIAVARLSLAQATPAPTVPAGAQEAASATAPTPQGDQRPFSGDAWEDYMKRYREIHKFPRDLVIRLTPNMGYPSAFMRQKMEIVDEDAEWVYMRNLPIEDPNSAAHRAWLMRQTIEVRQMARIDEAKGQFIMDPAVEHPIPPFTDRVHFEERSSGLPNQGRWGLGVAVADVNGDKLLDLVLPPPRLGVLRPAIYLQTPTGWRLWEQVVWPSTKLDYGDVKVADFDGDGNLDIALACHFLRNYVLYGNGKGDFSRFVELPRVGSKLSSRAMVTADFNGDGRPDLATLAELDVDLSTNEQLVGALLQIVLNTPKGWEVAAVSGADQHLYGDHLAVGDFDADGHPDLFVSSHKNSNRNLVFLNLGDGRRFLPVSSPEFPNRGYVFGVAAGDLDGARGDEALIGAYQSVRAGTEQYPMNGVVTYKLARDGEKVTVTRDVVSIDERDVDAYVTAAVGDVDGDGRNDLLVGRRNGQIEIYLQGMGGQYFREQSPELNLGDAYINALAVVPLAGKGVRAVVVVSSDGPSTPGTVRAFVVRPGPLTKAPAAR